MLVESNNCNSLLQNAGGCVQNQAYPNDAVNLSQNTSARLNSLGDLGQDWGLGDTFNDVADTIKEVLRKAVEQILDKLLDSIFGTSPQSDGVLAPLTNQKSAANSQKQQVSSQSSSYASGVEQPSLFGEIVEHAEDIVEIGSEVVEVLPEIPDAIGDFVEGIGNIFEDESNT